MSTAPDLDFENLKKCIADKFGVSIDVIMSNSQKRYVTTAKRIIVNIIIRVHNHTQASAGKHIGVGRPRACKMFNEHDGMLRSDPAYKTAYQHTLSKYSEIIGLESNETLMARLTVAHERQGKIGEEINSIVRILAGRGVNISSLLQTINLQRK
jgi:hypothetical protein